MEWITISAFRWAIGLVGCLFVLCIISLLSRLIKEESMKAMKWIPCLGENSLAIYCLSVSLLSSYLPRIYNWIVQMLGYNLFAENMMLYNLVFTPLLTVLYALILLGAISVASLQPEGLPTPAVCATTAVLPTDLLSVSAEQQQERTEPNTAAAISQWRESAAGAAVRVP